MAVNLRHYGYYFFLGIGDFPRPSRFTSEWTSMWDRDEWMHRLDRLAELGSNTLFLYLMSYQLPYASKLFPQFVEEGHPNVRRDFLQDVLDGCAERGIEVTPVFTSTGHCWAFAAAHQELVITDRDEKPRAGSGVCCHNKKDGLAFGLGVIRECLSRYHGFKGVIVHPPEFSAPCFCQDCQKAYSQKTGASLLAAGEEDAQTFFMNSYLKVQRDVIEPEIRARVPGVQLYTFTIPWLFAARYEELAPDIDKSTIIIDWDYDLSDKAIEQLGPRLKRYQKSGHEIWFMPTAGYSMDPKHCNDDEGMGPQENEDAATAVHRQIQIALDAGIHDIVYFTGPIWWKMLEATSWHLHGSPAR